MNDKDPQIANAESYAAELNKKITDLERSNGHLREEIRLMKEYLKNLQIVPR